MSMDNVLAVAGVTRDNTVLSKSGLALSVPFMIFAATLIAKVLTRHPWIANLGMALILHVPIVMSWDCAHNLMAARSA